MTISAHRAPPGPVLELVLVLMLVIAMAPDRLQAQAAVPVTFNADLQVSKLHPSVTGVGFGCTTPLPAALPSPGGGQLPTTSAPYARAGPVPVVNRAFSGIVSATVSISAAILAIPANRTLTTTCTLHLYRGAGYLDAVATAAQPQTITSQNSAVVGVGSAVTWSQTITIQ